jgi:hypothetical protein
MRHLRCVCESFEPRLLLAAVPVGAARDTDFGSDGMVVTDTIPGFQTATDKAYDARALTDGDFVIVGAGGDSGYNLGAVVRYNADGSLDTGFGQGGIALYGGGPDSARLNWHAAAPSEGGKVVVAGEDYARVPWIPATARSGRSSPATTPTARSTRPSAGPATGPSAHRSS